MTPLPPTPTPVIRVDLQWAVEGDPMGLTRLFWQYTGGPPTGSNLASIANQITAALDTNLLPLMGSWVQNTGVKCTNVGTAVGPQGFASGTGIGSRTGNRLAPGTCALVNYSVPILYRGGKPRSYFPFGTDADIATTGLWADAFLSDVNNGVLAFATALAAVAAGTVTLTEQCNVSYYDGFDVIISPTTGRARNRSLKRTVPVVTTISGLSAAKNIGSQRRRNRNA
jgi:hypothetical protein